MRGGWWIGWPCSASRSGNRFCMGGMIRQWRYARRIAVHELFEEQVEKSPEPRR